MLNFYRLQVSEQHRPQIRVYITHLEAGIQYWQKSTEREREREKKEKRKNKANILCKNRMQKYIYKIRRAHDKYEII